MCLITKNKVRVAQRDITVFRDVRVLTKNTWCGWIYDRVDFPFNEVVTARKFNNSLEVYEEINHLNPEYINITKLYYIDEGFHSYRLNSSSHICIIPKESEYCYGKRGKVVSKDIIVFSSYKEYFKYKWKKLLEKIF